MRGTCLTISLAYLLGTASCTWHRSSEHDLRTTAPAPATEPPFAGLAGDYVRGFGSDMPERLRVDPTGYFEWTLETSLGPVRSTFGWAAREGQAIRRGPVQCGSYIFPLQRFCPLERGERLYLVAFDEPEWLRRTGRYRSLLAAYPTTCCLRMGDEVKPLQGTPRVPAWWHDTTDALGQRDAAREPTQTQ